MNNSGFQQDDNSERKYNAAKEAMKTAINAIDQLRPDQQQRLLQELIQEKGLEELWNRLQLLFAQR